MACDDWDPAQITRVRSQKKELSVVFPFAQDRDVSAPIPATSELKSDYYIDDIISVAPDVNDNLERLIAESWTVFHAVSNQSSLPIFIPLQDITLEDKN